MAKIRCPECGEVYSVEENQKTIKCLCGAVLQNPLFKVTEKHVAEAKQDLGKREYKVISGPSIVQGGILQGSAAYEKIINDQAEYGWIFDSIEPITTQETGCFSSKDYQTSYMIIFHRDIK